MEITSTAVRKVREMGDKHQPEGYALRIIVDVGGPEGFFYDLDFETQQKPEDHVMVADGLTVYVDENSWARFQNGIVDYVDTPEFSGFHFENPDQPTGPTAGAPLSERVQWVLDTEINPAVAAHGGNVSLVEVKDFNVLLRFGGGCQGCSSSSATLKRGIETSLREKFPEIGEIIVADVVKTRVKELAGADRSAIEALIKGA